MTLRTLTTLLALSVTLVGCPGEEGEDTDVDTGTDAPDVSAYALPDGVTGVTGNMSYAADVVGFDEDNASIDESCLAEFTITGTEFTGDCNDCEWAFELDVSETSNNCTTVDANLTLVEAVEDGTVIVAYWPEYYGPQATYTDVIAAGAIFDYGGTNYMSFEQLAALEYYGTQYGADVFNFSSEGVDWEVAGSEEEFISTFESPACEADYAAAPIDAAIAGTSTSNGDLPCEQGDTTETLIFDTYTIAATEGDAVTVSVDTIADVSAFDSYITVLAPSGCTIGSADDIYDCSFEPADFQCSGFSFDAQETGDYLVIVGSYGSCNGDATTGQYVFASTSDTHNVDQDNVGFGDADVSVDLATSFTLTTDISFSN